MGAKTWMLVYSDGAASQALKSRPELDRDAATATATAAALAKQLFPSEKMFEPLADVGGRGEHPAIDSEEDEDDTMKITSADDICWISVTPNEARYSGFDVVTHVNIDHGQFEARNTDVHFLNFEEFLSEFDKFIMDRHRAPRLEGTYDTYISFSGTGTSVICAYRLGDAFCGRKKATFYQSGEFEIQQERLLEFLHGFQKLLDQQRL